jgi:hypothetical protein
MPAVRAPVTALARRSSVRSPLATAAWLSESTGRSSLARWIDAHCLIHPVTVSGAFGAPTGQRRLRRAGELDGCAIGGASGRLGIIVGSLTVGAILDGGGTLAVVFRNVCRDRCPGGRLLSVSVTTRGQTNTRGLDTAGNGFESDSPATVLTHRFVVERRAPVCRYKSDDPNGPWSPQNGAQRVSAGPVTADSIPADRANQIALRLHGDLPDVAIKGSYAYRDPDEGGNDG